MNLLIMAFDKGYTQLFGYDNQVVLKDGKTVHLSLDERAGCLLVLNCLVCYMCLVVWTFESLIEIEVLLIWKRFEDPFLCVKRSRIKHAESFKQLKLASTKDLRDGIYRESYCATSCVASV